MFGVSQKSYGGNLGFKFIGGAQKENLDGLLVKSDQGDGDFAIKADRAFTQSPELVGYQVGAGLYYQPLIEVPVSAGVYLTRRDLASRQESVQLTGFQSGLEFNVWYPHGTVEPYLMFGGGLWGSTYIQGESDDFGSEAMDYAITGRSRLAKGGLGLRLHSTKQLSAYFQIDIGIGGTAGKVTTGDFQNPSQPPLSEEPSEVFLENALLQSRAQSVSIGIEWM